MVVEMKKSLIFSFIIASLVIGLAIILIAAFTGFPWDRDGNAKGRAVNGTQEEKDANGAQSEEIPGNDLDEKNQPSIAGIQLYADREQVVEILGTGYQETFYEEAGHFPEPFVIWKYESGFEICIENTPTRSSRLPQHRKAFEAWAEWGTVPVWKHRAKYVERKVFMAATSGVSS